MHYPTNISVSYVHLQAKIEFNICTYISGNVTTNLAECWMHVVQNLIEESKLTTANEDHGMAAGLCFNEGATWGQHAGRKLHQRQ